MSLQSILISGAGIAGPMLAYWLEQHGFRPTIVEKAPTFRKGGYLIDFWGIGFEVAERMNLVPELRRRGYQPDEVKMVNNRGDKVGGMSVDIFRDNLDDRYLSILRGDLAEAIYQRIDGKVETIFDDTITGLEENTDSVAVNFERSKSRNFDLVIGADGLHSNVRRIVFDENDNFETELGYCVAAFSAQGYKPRDEGAYVAYSTPGKQIARYAVGDDKTVFFLIFKHNAIPSSETSAVKLLQATFENDGWESRQILKEMQNAKDLYFDSVNQVRMPVWSKGRVALVGDAAFCPSLLAGQGSSLAAGGSYVLAGELKRSQNDYAKAFQNYESLLRPLITRKQDSALGFASWFAPDTVLKIFVRNQITKLFSIPIIARQFVKQSISDNLNLPNY